MNGIQRIEQQFAQGKVFVGYLTAGDGGIERTFEAAMALIEGGVNVLEIGMPFSDPIADGPVIQRAAARSLAHGTVFNDILALVRRLRQSTEIPLILFSYLNPILFMLNSCGLQQAEEAGIDGLLIVDCPLEESTDLRAQCARHGLAFINVIAISTPAERIRLLSRYGTGFLYYACRPGTTGVRLELPEDFHEKIQKIREQVDWPVVVGFGISTAAAVQEVLQSADGVVVGSLFVKALEEGAQTKDLKCLAQSLLAG